MSEFSGIGDLKDRADFRFLSLGAGVQSTEMLYKALDGDFGNLPDAVIFADTGWEPKAVYEHLKNLESRCSEKHVPFYKVSNGNLRQDIVNKVTKNTRWSAIPAYTRGVDGKTGLMRRQCTYDYKIAPITRKVRELMGVTKGKHMPRGIIVQRWIGISTDEAHRMKDSREKWAVHVYPLIEANMSRKDCEASILRRGLAIPPKSACIGCPFHQNDFWRHLKTFTPDEFEEAVEIDEMLRSGVKEATSELFLHFTRVPLRMADLSIIGKKDDFGNECEGMCGV